jgi:Fur family transcriptional regulator, stress-responsive regulator
MRADAAPSAPPEVALLREAGLRLTPQRLVIAREILARSHPTAGEIFDAVRRQFPTIGLATVYATFNLMAERGSVRALPFAQAVRYDVNAAVVIKDDGQPGPDPALVLVMVPDVKRRVVGDTPCLTAADDSGYEIEEAEVIYE